MENMIESKTNIMNEINNIFINYQNKMEEISSNEKKLMKEKELINQANHRLIEEITEKDKLLFHNEKKFYDYEVMINKIQDEALKEMDEKTKHDMLRAQDKEIFHRDEEIKRLQKKIQSLEEGNKSVISPTSTVEEVIEDFEEPKELHKNEKKEVQEEEEKKEVQEEEVEDCTVTTIRHYNKDYYIIDGEEPIQYIYAIEDGELGEVKGEMKDGKKNMYKKKN